MLQIRQLWDWAENEGLWTRSRGLFLQWYFWVPSQTQTFKKRLPTTSTERSQRARHLKLRAAFEKDLATPEVCYPLWLMVPQDSQVTAGYVQHLLMRCLSPTSTPVGSATEECKALHPSILRLHRHTQGGLVWFGVACTEVRSRLFYVRYLQIQKTKGKL